jgi:hypothetical protein
MNHSYTSMSAIEYSKLGKLDEWVHSFLRGEGNNIPFSTGLKLENRYFIGPVRMPLDIFQRCCGPEDNMKHQIDRNGFEYRVDAMGTRLQNGWDMPPLIINYANGRFELNDGNHRYEALIRSGVKEYHVIVWITGQNDYEQFISGYGDYIQS